MYSNEIIYNILIYIDNNIQNKITIDEIAKYINYNKYYIMKLFRKEINQSITNYINYLKIYNSLKYYSKNKSILSISLLSGFNSLEYYSELFKKTLGITPKCYKKYRLYNNISNNEYNIFINNYLKITELIEYTKKYKANKKTIIYPTKKLSIFR